MKKQIGFLKALTTSIKAKKMTSDEIRQLQKERFQKILQHARINSSYYKEKYKHLGESPSLKELPPVTKRELMAEFEDWITDPTIKLAELQTFIKAPTTLVARFRRNTL